MSGHDAAQAIPGNEYRRVRWRNGGGWTREIHAENGGDGEDWLWRLSIAEIEREAAFSTFPGVDRELVLLQGEGLQLDFGDGGERHALAPPHGRLRFAGERESIARPAGGGCHVFNLMWRRAQAAAQLWHRPLVGPMVIFVDPGSVWAVHLLAGDARLPAPLPPLAMGDTALLRTAGARSRYLLEGAGEALLIRIDALDRRKPTIA